MEKSLKLGFIGPNLATFFATLSVVSLVVVRADRLVIGAELGVFFIYALACYASYRRRSASWKVSGEVIVLIVAAILFRREERMINAVGYFVQFITIRNLTPLLVHYALKRIEDKEANQAPEPTAPSGRGSS